MTLTPCSRGIICVLYTGVITALSLAPARDLGPDLIPYQDKLAHAVMYGILALLWHWTLEPQHRRQSWLWRTGIVIGAALYGLGMEFLQGAVTPDRQCSTGDMAANLAGALLAMAVIPLVKRKRLV